jgi:hypothetical protein
LAFGWDNNNYYRDRNSLKTPNPKSEKPFGSRNGRTIKDRTIKDRHFLKPPKLQQYPRHRLK